MTQDTPRRGIVRCGVSARPAGAARAVAVAVALLASALGVSSPAAAQAQPFSDTSEDAFYSDAVNALADGGLFEGTECAPGMLCPGEPIDRKTMAVWTVRALDSQNPAPITNSRFSDVTDGSFHAPFIERMAELGVTKGCGDSTFCPDDTVTRYQMAVFLTRAFDLEPGPDPGFTDVTPSAWYYNDVAALAASAITAGCGNGTFCPNQQTSRGQMATFLARATGLVDLPQPPTPAQTYTAITAGSNHSCALRTDNTITCWGNNGRGGPTRPTANTAPSPPAAATLAPCEPTTPSHAGATTAKTDLYRGQADAPDGQYTAITAGGEPLLRPANRQHHHMLGQQLGAAGQGRRARRPIHRHHRRRTGHSCALRTDNTITCWGTTGWGRPTRPTANTPPSPPAAATLAPCEPTTPSHAGATTARGRPTRPTANTAPSPPAAPLLRPANRQHHHMLGQQRLGAGRRARRPIHRHHRRRRPLLRPANRQHHHMLGQQRPGAGRRARRPIQRHHRRLASTLAPCEPTTPSHAGATTTRGRPTRPTANTPPSPPAASHSCALRTDNTITCWGNNEDGQTDAPDGQYTAITAGISHSCALRTDNTITCWGWNDYGADRRARRPIQRHHRRLRGHSCALRTDNTITCWGCNRDGQADAPDGQYTAITAGTFYSCALRTDNTITCWGNNNSGQTDAPDGQYTAITTGGSHSCALRTDNTITCWGHNEDGQADAPDGQYTAITAGGNRHSCALRTDGTITCWPMLPDGVNWVAGGG